MMKRMPKISVMFTLLLFFFVGIQNAEALVLSSPYTLANIFSTSLNGSTGIVTVSGTVTALPGNQPNTATAYFKTKKQGQSVWFTHPNMTIGANGDFQTTLGGLECQQNYDFKLFQNPPETEINYVSPGQGGAGFQYVIACGTQQAGGGDIITTFSAPEFLNGVNWGTISSTDTTISLNNAHLLPLAPTTVPKKFKIEYGYGVAGQPNYNDVEGFTEVQTAFPPNYNFNSVISGLAPNTEYYFTLYECDNTGTICTNLFTYGFAPTNLLNGTSVDHSFETPTTMKVYGTLTALDNTTFYNVPIEIIIKDENGTELLAAETVTGPQSVINGGYFEHLFFGMTSAPANMIPGEQYTYNIVNQFTNLDITPPQTFTMPPADTGTGGSGPGTSLDDTPTYDGLVACGGDPSSYDCDFNAFLETVNRVVNFLIVFVAFPFVAIVIAWAGILILTSGGSPAAREKAKGMIGNVIIGLIVALLAWVIIKLVLSVFGYVPSGQLWSILGTQPLQ